MYIITTYILFSLGRKNLQFGQFCFLVFLSVSNLWALAAMFLKHYLQIQGCWKIIELTYKTNVENLVLENIYSLKKSISVSYFRTLFIF